MASREVDLAKAIAALRQQLLSAIAEGDGADMKFKLAPVELSLEVTLSTEADGKIGGRY
jgi:hypothetical protein